MKTWSKSSLVSFGMGAWLLGNVWGATVPGLDMDSAIQAVKQAPDPSAAVAAYANGFAVDRNEPKLYAAFVSRMIDLGLPELAYHQAQTLTTLDSNNGLGWGVVAYVDARRAQMPEALSAIILAGQFAPDNSFVQRTSGEILAWYDMKADKTQLPSNTKEGVANLRNLLSNRAAYIAGYDTAKKAYQGQASGGTQPGQGQGVGPSGQLGPPSTVMPPETPPAYGAYPETPPPYAYYPDYYDWGPGWVEPAPWWWWQPAGFFVGFNFVPCRPFFVFDDFHFFSHHHFIHHDGLVFENRFHRDGHFFPDPAGRTAFFGTRARASSSFSWMGRANLASDPPVASARRGVQTRIAG